MKAPLADRLALVTGGATRLGAEISLALANAGAHVAISYLHSAESASKTTARITELGRRAAAFRCDVTDAAQIDAMFARVRAEMGALDLFVFAAGVFRRTPIESASDEDWDWHMNTNARGAYLCARCAGLAMRDRRGAIVLIADVAGLRPWPNYVPYSASKAAVVSLTQGLAMALAPSVRVNAVAPGPILPPAGDEEALERAAKRTLLGRHGQSKDITKAVVYLATADYVTGVVLPVDGGRHLA